YTITAKDANGCTGTAPATITVPRQVLETARPTQSSSVGGTGTLTAGASGGTGAYTFSKDGITFQASATFSGLSAGTYTITAKDRSEERRAGKDRITVPTQEIATAKPTQPSWFGGRGTMNAGATAA